LNARIYTFPGGVDCDILPRIEDSLRRAKEGVKPQIFSTGTHFLRIESMQEELVYEVEVNPNEIVIKVMDELVSYLPDDMREKLSMWIIRMPKDTRALPILSTNDFHLYALVEIEY
jgi:hypothetical protein